MMRAYSAKRSLVAATVHKDTKEEATSGIAQVEGKATVSSPVISQRTLVCVIALTDYRSISFC